MAMESKRLYIAEISATTSEKTLHDYFIKYGKIVDSEVIKNRFTGLNRGFGFVTFADSSSCAKELQDEHVILETKVKVDIARPKVTYRNCQGDSQISDVINPKRIFVGGLPKALTSKEFKNYFKSFGTIIHVTIMKDQYDRSRGFGYITFDSKEAVDKVLSVKQHEISGKFVDVQRAQYHKNFETPQNCTYNSHSCGGCLCYGNGFESGYGMLAMNTYYHAGSFPALGSPGGYDCYYNNSYQSLPFYYWSSPSYATSFHKNNVPKVVIGHCNDKKSSPIRITRRFEEIDGVNGTNSVGDSCKDAGALMVIDIDKSPQNMSDDGYSYGHLNENGFEDQNGMCKNIEPASQIHEGENGTCNNLEVQVVENGVGDQNGSCSEFETLYIEPDSRDGQAKRTLPCKGIF